MAERSQMFYKKVYLYVYISVNLVSSYIHLTLTNRESFEKIYRDEENVKTKERMLLLVLNVVYQGMVSAQVARDIHRSKTWACECINRNDNEGIDGLKNRQK